MALKNFTNWAKTINLGSTIRFKVLSDWHEEVQTVVLSITKNQDKTIFVTSPFCLTTFTGCIEQAEILAMNNEKIWIYLSIDDQDNIDNPVLIEILD